MSEPSGCGPVSRWRRRPLRPKDQRGHWPHSKVGHDQPSGAASLEGLMRGIVPVALTPFTPDETRAQRGTAVLVFRSRRCARAVEGSRPGIWKMPLEGGHETLLAPGTQFLFTDSWSEGICFLNVDKNPPEIEQMDFATDRARRVGTLDVGSLAK